jgi:hypothetical protein
VLGRSEPGDLAPQHLASPQRLRQDGAPKINWAKFPRPRKREGKGLARGAHYARAEQSLEPCLESPFHLHPWR